MGFRNDFVWGAAASSYQVEGAVDADGMTLQVMEMDKNRIDKVKMTLPEPEEENAETAESSDTENSEEA